MARAVRCAVAGGLVCVSLLLAGYRGYVDREVSRFRSVSARLSQVTISGYDDQYSYSICAYQQSRNPSSQYVLGCSAPDRRNKLTDACGKVWYRWSFAVWLMNTDEAWFKDAGAPEYTRLYVARNNAQGGLYTSTGDEARGPSDSTTCFDSRIGTNSGIVPLVYYNGAVPADLNCANGSRAYGGCPFSCSLATGCDMQYGRTQDEFTSSSARVNFNGQDTSKTQFDMWAANYALPPPTQPWGYRLESGTCSGGTSPGAGCDASSECAGGGTCSPGSWTVMRRPSVYEEYESLNIRRGESRRSSLVEAWLKMKRNDPANQQLALVNRWYDINNYFAFTVMEYPFDVVSIHTRVNAIWTAVGYSYPAMNLLTWNRVGFKVIDNGSYSGAGQFTPDGTCAATGYINGASVINFASTPCGHAPYGNHGVLSYKETGAAQLFDLDATPCSTNGTCL